MPVAIQSDRSREILRAKEALQDDRMCGIFAKNVDRK